MYTIINDLFAKVMKTMKSGTKIMQKWQKDAKMAENK